MQNLTKDLKTIHELKKICDVQKDSEMENGKQNYIS